MKVKIYIPKGKERVWQLFKLLCYSKGLSISQVILMFIEAWVEIESKRAKGC
jgi:hypothetical protein